MASAEAEGGRPAPEETPVILESLQLRAKNALAMAEAIKRGLSYKKFEAFRAKTQMPAERLARAAQIPKRNLARRRKTGKFTKEESERLVRIAMIFDRALQLFEGDDAAARQWLVTPNRAFGSKSPLDVAETEIGGREVEALIGRLEMGVYS